MVLRFIDSPMPPRGLPYSTRYMCLCMYFLPLTRAVTRTT